MARIEKVLETILLGSSDATIDLNDLSKRRNDRRRMERNRKGNRPNNS